jgi:alkanesulfonate monooxygenase SsuD/methylene tetrahydromethanopterin reductase-like flavin-dependent oxidoreductase (luciferase family)
MRLNLAYEMQRPVVDDHAVIEETIEQCLLADRMGFDAVWFVEHHFLTSFSMSPCPEVIFGAQSRLTKRIRLGFGVVILPYHHPVRVAERVAMVDHMSGGRVESGTGRSTSRAAPARSPARSGTRSTPTPSSSAASSWPAIPRAACGASPSTRRPASTRCSSSWPPRPWATSR